MNFDELMHNAKYIITMSDNYEFIGLYIKSERGFLVFLNMEDDKLIPIRPSNIKNISLVEAFANL